MSVISLRCGLYIRFAKGKEGNGEEETKEGEREGGVKRMRR